MLSQSDKHRRDWPDPPHAHEARWQGWVAALVALGCLATAVYTIVETFWG